MQWTSGRGTKHAQLAHALREGARSGRLATGATVPSTRALARDLGVSRGVVVEAYEQLVAEGFLATRPGARTIIAARAAAPVLAAPPPRGEVARYDFRPGRPDLTLFPRVEWGRAARSVLRSLRPTQLDYGDPRGAPELCTALAEYLGRVRGAVCDPSQIVVCSGFAQALGVAGRCLARAGVRRVAVEDPGHPELRHLLTASGLETVPLPVDRDGLRVDRLDGSRAQAVLLSPAHQFPTGSVLAPERRRVLLDWAERCPAFVIEDDYDAEYRYDRLAVGALQGLAPGRLLYAGSASKILAPGLRLGWLAVPPALLAAATEIKRDADLGTPFLEQLVYAAFLRNGSLDRHLRGMRSVYRRRREALLAALGRHFPDWSIHGAAAGLHVMIELPRGTNERRLVERAAARSVKIYALSDYAATNQIGRPGLVLGYSSLTADEIRTGIGRLADLRGRAGAA